MSNWPGGMTQAEAREVAAREERRAAAAERDCTGQVGALGLKSA